MALMAHQPWTVHDVPSQHGRTAVVTGTNTGLGFETARILAQLGAAVVLTCRTEAKGAEAADRIRALAPDSAVTTLQLNLASQASVREAAERLRGEHQRIDLLINNAGMLGSTERQVTEDGFEATFATNHLGVFAFTGLVLDRLLPVPGSRVVTLSSITNRFAALDFDDLQSQNGYRRDRVYSRSKLANLMFSYELQRRLTAAGVNTLSVAAHPGQSRTEFTRDLNPVLRFLYGPRARRVTSLLMQDKTIGVLGTIRAAVDLDVEGGAYFGPSGPLQLTGHPVHVASSGHSHDAAALRRLWEESERLTNVTYPLLQPQSSREPG